ncbi:MAG: hypothetical protein HY976_03475 [Candidatus Kerfeldbacteria bacterium]|nr:hypothetical protein [Candidatus Kerfeldbacteria bacterium]
MPVQLVSQPKDRIQELMRVILGRLNGCRRRRPTPSTQQRQRDHWARTVVVEARTYQLLKAREFRVLRAVLRKYAAYDSVVRRAAQQIVEILYKIRRLATLKGQTPFTNINRRTGPHEYPGLLRPRNFTPKRTLVPEWAYSWSAD